MLTSFIGRLLAWYVRLSRRVVIRGSLPATACVAVSFHRSYWDGLLVCMLDPRITAVTSRAWKTTRGIGWFLENYGVLWTGEDVVARASRYVADGGICWLAPYGFVRSGQCPHPHSGAAQIAQATGAPIVCVTLKDGRSPGIVPGRRALTILIGTPWPTVTGEPVGAITDRLVASLREQER